jgi:hypothetical protein
LQISFGEALQLLYSAVEQAAQQFAAYQSGLLRYEVLTLPIHSTDCAVFLIVIWQQHQYLEDKT